MSNSVLREYNFDLILKEKLSLKRILAKTTINGEDITFNINLDKPIEKYFIEELFNLIKDNFYREIEALNFYWVKPDDIGILHSYLFTEHEVDTKEVIEARWIEQCNLGRIQCGEYVDLAIVPMRGIYQNSSPIKEEYAIGSWSQLAALKSIEGKDVKEVAKHISFLLDYSEWVYEENKVLELAELFSSQYPISNTTDVTTSILIALTGLLADEEKLDRLIGSSLTVEAKDLLDKIIKGTNAIIDCGVNNFNSKIIDKMEIF